MQNGDYYLITGTDFLNGKINYENCYYVSKERFEQDKKIKVNDGNILITKDGTLGKVAYIEHLNKPATLNTGIFNVSVKDTDKNNGKFLYYFLSAPFLMDYAKKNATGGTIKHLNQKILVNFPVNSPDYSEQTKISCLLKMVQNIITLHEEKLRLLKLLRKSLLQSLFAKVAEIPYLRFQQTENSWSLKRFGDIYYKVSEKNDLSFGPDKIISVAKMYYKIETKKSNEKYMKTYNVFRLGDIAFEGNKSSNYKFGRFVENDIGDGIVSHVFDVFRPYHQQNLAFWKYLINNENVMQEVLRKSTTKSTMMTNLVSKDFLKRKISIPDNIGQQKIGELLTLIDRDIRVENCYHDNISRVQKFLLKCLFVS